MQLIRREHQRRLDEGEARVLSKRWRIHHTSERPHSSLGCRPPGPETIRSSAGRPAPLRSASRPAWRKKQRCT